MADTAVDRLGKPDQPACMMWRVERHRTLADKAMLIMTEREH
jgi:hypothetical protein